jgi:hypothetical protein
MLTAEEVLERYHIQHTKRSRRSHGLAMPENSDEVVRTSFIKLENDL